MCPRFRAVGFVESRSVDRREAIGVPWVTRGRVAGLPERLRNRAPSHGASRAHNPKASSSRHQSAAKPRATCRRRSYPSRIGDPRGSRWSHRGPRDSVAPPPRARAQTHVKPCGASPPSPLWHALSPRGCGSARLHESVKSCSRDPYDALERRDSRLMDGLSAPSSRERRGASLGIPDEPARLGRALSCVGRRARGVSPTGRAASRAGRRWSTGR